MTNLVDLIGVSHVSVAEMLGLLGAGGFMRTTDVFNFFFMCFLTVQQASLDMYLK